MSLIGIRITIVRSSNKVIWHGINTGKTTLIAFKRDKEVKPRKTIIYPTGTLVLSVKGHKYRSGLNENAYDPSRYEIHRFTMEYIDQQECRVVLEDSLIPLISFPKKGVGEIDFEFNGEDNG